MNENSFPLRGRLGWGVEHNNFVGCRSCECYAVRFGVSRKHQFSLCPQGHSKHLILPVFLSSFCYFFSSLYLRNKERRKSSTLIKKLIKRFIINPHQEFLIFKPKGFQIEILSSPLQERNKLFMQQNMLFVAFT